VFVGEAVLGPAVDDGLPVGARRVEFEGERREIVDRDVRIGGAVTDEDPGGDRSGSGRGMLVEPCSAVQEQHAGAGPVGRVVEAKKAGATYNVTWIT
jgi:hypothetical protein